MRPHITHRLLFRPDHRTASTALLVGLLIFAAPLLPHASGIERSSSDSGTHTWGMTPATEHGPDDRGHFEYIVGPGERYEDHVAVRNFGDSDLVLDLAVHDATQQDGSFELLGSDEVSIRVGAWVTLEQTRVSVPARSNLVVPFTLVVPDDAEPGDHAGGLVAVSVINDDSDTVMQYRVGTRLHARVAGPIQTALSVNTVRGTYSGRLSPVHTGTLNVNATLVNSSNIRLTTEATITVTGLFGLWSRTGHLDEIPELLPSGASTTSTLVEEVPPIGPLWVSVTPDTVTSLGQDVTEITAIESRSVLLWAMPWTFLAVIGLLLLACAVALVNARRQRRFVVAHANVTRPTE